MAEFEIIDKFFNFGQVESSTKKVNLVKGIGDDCAILNIPKNKQLVTSTDTLNSGVHFFNDASPSDIAYKALAVNVSDLLAMGAEPLAFTLAISLPEINDKWLAEFSGSLKKTSELFNIELVGGDTTKGDLSLNLTVFGTVKRGKALLRSGANLADDIWVTGTLGGARAGLNLHEKSNLNLAQKELWLQLVKPQLPFKFARKYRKYSHAAIDLSDGLLADLGHIIIQSNLGAKIAVETLPLLESLIEQQGLEQARQFALAGGDDYQLCFTASPEKRAKLEKLANKTQTQITRIGTIVKQGLSVTLSDEPFAITENSWQHFQSN